MPDASAEESCLHLPAKAALLQDRDRELAACLAEAAQLRHDFAQLKGHVATVEADRCGTCCNLLWCELACCLF